MKNLSYLLIIILNGSICLAQNIGINATGALPDSSSLLDLSSTSSGLLAPRMTTTQMNAITRPANGLMVYNTTLNTFLVNTGTASSPVWVAVITTEKTRNNYVLVKSVSDLPAPVSGVITLVAGTLYEVNGTVTLTNMIDLNGCTLTGLDIKNDKLVYTPGSGELFTGVNGGSILYLTISATGVGSKLFNIDGGGSATKNIFMDHTAIQSCNNVGLIKGIGGVVSLESVIYIGNTNGITFQDIGDFAQTNVIWTPTNHNTFQKFVGTFSTISMMAGEIQTLAAFSAIALDISGLTSITKAAALKTTQFIGDGTYLVGSFSNKWEVETYGLNTEKDGVSSGNLYITSPVTTTFTAANTPTKILGTTTPAGMFRVSSATNNRLTYLGNKSRRFLTICSMTATQSSSNILYTFYIAKNGVILPESRQETKWASSTDQQSVTITCSTLLGYNDYIEVWVSNNTNTTGLTVQSLNLTME